MCGIVGGVAQRDISDILLEGLYRLEYRGYDSAGMAGINTLSNDPALVRLRAMGKVSKLDEALQDTPLPFQTGIAHTRWATHGKPSEDNAHPHISHDEIAIVHNGIVENHEELRQQLEAAGYEFTSQTDTEVVAHLVHKHYQANSDLIYAVQQCCEELKGSFALAVIHKDHPQRLISVCYNSPLVIGLADNENFIASDQLALITLTQRFIYLEQGNIADISTREVTVYSQQGEVIHPDIHSLELNASKVELGEYRHYMLKEIHEQPTSLQQLIDNNIKDSTPLLEQLFDKAIIERLATMERVQIVGCGSSYHAGLIGKYWMEAIARLPCQVEFASEIRYRNNVVQDNTLFVTLSQSGETADTLAALRKAKWQHYPLTMTLCNVERSTLVRESDAYINIQAGTEIGVASTKAFTGQLLALLLLTLAIAEQRDAHAKRCELLKSQLSELPKQISHVIHQAPAIVDMANQLVESSNALFIGRGMCYPIALEGALKLKEITYMHAQAYPAGELKHGPLALVDRHLPIIALVPNTPLLSKMLSNLKEIQARHGKLFVFHDQSLPMDIQQDNLITLAMPPTVHEFTPLLYTIPLQLLAYYVAELKGNDIDQPRNLAKSVTVE